MEINSIIDDLLEEEGFSVWKNLNDYKDEVQNEYISEMEETNPEKNAEQSWRSKSGDFLEIFVKESVDDKLEDIKISLEKEIPKEIKEKLELDFSGKKKLPDLDLVVHKESEPIAIISCKTTTRERVSQTLFWKLALEKKNVDINFYLVTTDSDEELAPGRKWRPIIEEVMDNTFLVKEEFENSEGMKPYPELLDELRK
jgi:type II restriction enzyme